MTTLSSLPEASIKAAVAAALEEDLGVGGDITTQYTVPEATRSRVQIVARQPGIIAGLDLAREAFLAVDPNISFEMQKPDGSAVEPQHVIAEINGPARAILTAERVALNFVGHLSGIATATASFVKAVGDHKAQICCTRKTTPGLRLFEKYAVRAGGGVNHRFGLYDAILIKDNHIAMAGSIEAAIESGLNRNKDGKKFEVEVDSLEQLEAALAFPIDAVLLDNMSPDELRRAVAMIDGRAVAEASGGITIDTVKEVAATGVDLISIGWLTHSAPCLDIGLDYLS